LSQSQDTADSWQPETALPSKAVQPAQIEKGSIFGSVEVISVYSRLVKPWKKLIGELIEGLI
jgi:hypothetical protein